MKKLLLLFIPLICFFGCDKDEDNTENNSTIAYNCVNNDCFAEEGGQYVTLDDCLSVCTESNSDTSSWNCIENSCIELSSDTGTYSSLASCETECESISVFQSCLDAQGTWALNPECPPYELGPPLNIYVDVEDRFEDTTEILCIDEDNRLVIEFYGQFIYANIDLSGNLEIPSQVFQADFYGEGLDVFLDDDFFIDIQVTGEGYISNDYGVLSVAFSFVISEDMDWEDMTNCTILLSR